MNRIKIQLPEQFSFTTQMQIRVTDLNYGGHVGNDTILSLLQEARQQFLQSRGYAELRVESFGLIMADAMIEYKKELNHKDTIEIAVIATDFDKLGFDIYYRVTVLENGEHQLAVRAKTGMMLYDYTAKKKVSLSENIIQKLS
ncbi:thioesterase family protein [Sediminibacterium sp.]|uniref:acyl-CoA thioesterase n=1 Tax=Sediminibacterium sp. TaxID=1917865 RepID=UPI002726FA05|nr:thioesterase family protein [Sediminibacterium sp.]MDO8995893.1 thioesterase family protein [Sediminibacterium sp.]MDO9156044.1 thioesterase family protein [Sediminibacterium sp.]MDP1973496.1 thioesterase family protein [Sediminibacterium sp.]MDP2420331.1 thioesterase family protein [Sediminibacterium sp.]